MNYTGEELKRLEFIQEIMWSQSHLLSKNQSEQAPSEAEFLGGTQDDPGEGGERFLHLVPNPQQFLISRATQLLGCVLVEKRAPVSEIWHLRRLLL